jgi:plastocyanin
VRRSAIALALLASAVLAPAAASQQHAGGHDAGGAAARPAAAHSASIGFDSVRPARLDIVTGESVTWTNESSRVHTVTADDDRFDSGRISSSQTFTHRFTTAGEAAYHCTLHPLIAGVVAVGDLLLDAPGQAAAPGRPFPLTGRTALAAGTAVAIEADSGAGFVRAGTAAVGGDGRFAVRITPSATATYRAVAGTVTSAPVRLLVLDRRIGLTVRRAAHGRVRLQATVTPAARGGRVVLQLYLPERFGWWPVRQARLGAASRVTFALHPARRLRARVRYTLADGATALATSRIVRVGAPAARHHG